MEISDQQSKVTGLIVDLISSRLGADKGVHPMTAIISSARITGSILLRSCDLKLETYEPGSVLLSPEVNEKGPQLINILGHMLNNFGVTIDQSKLKTEKGEDSKLTYMETMNLFQNDVLDIIQTHKLSFEEGAQAIAISTAFIVKECASNTGAEAGFNAALYGFVEGSKTVPPYLTTKKKPWYKIW